jgi:carboxymethylenebutenolidase
MKKLVLVILLLLVFVYARAQSGNSCCTKPAATEQFAMLASDPAFRNLHLEPLPFVYQSTVGQTLTYKTPDGREATAFELKPARPSNRYLFVIHEWWGLNDYIKQEAERLYNDLGNVNVIALDLYDGFVATTREDAAKNMQALSQERARAIIQGAINHVGAKAQIATIGWCFGGGWSLQTAIMAGKQASGCVMYYGMPEKDVERLKTLQTEVLGHFAGREKNISPEVVREFEQNMQKANKKLTAKIYDAEHAFANPSNPRFDPVASREAYALTLEFLRRKIK